MKLTNATEKALAIIAMLATQESETSVSSEVLIKRLEISPSYTKKLLRKLVVSNMIDSVSGNGGGFKLKKELKDINLLEIIEAIEGKVETYPNHGTLKYAFSEFGEILETAEHVVEEIFSEADLKWKETMESYNLEIVLQKIFGVQMSKVDWNTIK